MFRANVVADFYFLYKSNSFPNLGNEHLNSFKLSYEEKSQIVKKKW